MESTCKKRCKNVTRHEEKEDVAESKAARDETKLRPHHCKSTSMLSSTSIDNFRDMSAEYKNKEVSGNEFRYVFGMSMYECECPFNHVFIYMYCVSNLLLL